MNASNISQLHEKEVENNSEYVLNIIKFYVRLKVLGREQRHKCGCTYN